MKMKKIIPFVITLLILAACSTASVDIAGDWKLVSYGDPSNPTPAIPNVDASINFDSKSQISGNVGCNGFGGSYKVSGGTITFSAIISTMMYCEETSAQEQAVLSAFSDNVKLQFQLDGNTLTITSADGSAVVVLERK
jgi:heat shock protein HslJ